MRFTAVHMITELMYEPRVIVRDSGKNPNAQLSHGILHTEQSVRNLYSIINIRAGSPSMVRTRKLLIESGELCFQWFPKAKGMLHGDLQKTNLQKGLVTDRRDKFNDSGHIPASHD